jgi:CheY-like chemotaxis protein
VPNSKTIKLLLVEDDREDQRLLAEAFIEIEENRQWCNWRTAGVLHVELLAEALDCLRNDRFDAVLLNLTLPDNPVLLDSFRQVTACARGTPIIVLADEEDQHLANQLLREGAQDVLLKSELESVPLARSLRYAIERQRRGAMIGSSPFADSLTGALTGPGFVTIATHAMRLSRLAPLLIASVEISELSKETPTYREARELLLLRATETLGAVFQPPALIGRLGPSRFGLLTAGLTETTVEALLNPAALAIENAARSDEGPAATVRFSVSEIYQGINLEELLFQDGDEFGAGTHRRSKTVMLAD